MQKSFMILKKKLVAVVLLLPIFLSSIANAESIKIINDDETEFFLQQIIKPLFIKADIPYNKNYIHIIEDNSLNAFVGDGNHLFIHTGTLIKADNVNELSGVIAHEIGHIKGGHILRQKLEIKEMNSLSLISALLAGSAGIVTGNPDLTMAILLGGQSSALNKFVHYRSNEERAADETATQLLNKTKQSPLGILNFMKKIVKQNQLSGLKETPYFRTHPITSERITFFENKLNENKYTTQSPYDKEFAFVKAKLKAYLNNPKTTIKEYEKCQQQLYCQYALSLAYFRDLQFEKAFKYINKLINKLPQNPYFYEIKGQMEMETGKISEAVKSFTIANQINPSAEGIQTSYAFALLEENETNANATKAIMLLDKLLLNNPHNYFLWNLRVKAASRLGDMPAVYYATAEMAHLRKENDKALKYLEKAKKVSPNHQLKIKIDDLATKIQQEKNRK